MKLQHYTERLERSIEFKKFKKENPKSYLCAGFFVIDFEASKNLYHLDYYLPKQKKIATFMLEDGIKLKIGEQIKEDDKNKMKELKGDSRLDLEMLKGIVEDEMHNHTVTGKIMKIIAVFMMLDNRKVWSINSILSGLNIVNIHIEDASDTILKFEKLSMMDIVKKI